MDCAEGGSWFSAALASSLVLCLSRPEPWALWYWRRNEWAGLAGAYITNLLRHRLRGITKNWAT
eukprot:10218758-Prorocentrum_lima.AAC.1